MEQILLSGDFYAPEREQSKRGIFDETGIHKPKAYLRLFRMYVKRHIRKFGLYYVTIAILLLMSAELRYYYVTEKVNHSKIQYIDDSDRYDLTAEDY